MCGNSRKPDRLNAQRLLRDLTLTLRTTLPPGWRVEVEQDAPEPVQNRNPSGPDAIVTIQAPDGKEVLLVTEIKSRLSPRDVPAVVNQIRSYQEALGAASGLVIAPFLPPRTRDLLTEAKLSYADTTGNLRLAFDKPATFIYTVGAPSDPWAAESDRSLRSLRGPTAGRVVRALCDFRPPFGVQQLAERSGTSLGSVSRVFTLLDADALIVRERYGPVTDVRWADLIRRWTADYSFSRSNHTRTYLEPRGLPSLLEKLRTAPLRYAVTGSHAAATVAPITAPRIAMIYTDDAIEASERLRLRPAEAGANVILAEPFDPVVYDRMHEIEGIGYAAPSQVAADLLTGPGRNPAEGEELIRWMQEHEDAWRS